MQITAAVANDATGPFALEQIELDEPRSDEVLVRLVASGVCHTDLVFKGWLQPDRGPVVFGHEGAGVVEAVGGEVTTVRPGDHVLMSYLRCGACPQCRAGQDTYCRDFTALNFGGTRHDGSTTMRRHGTPVFGSFFGQSSFATHALAYEQNLVVVGDDVDLTLAAPLGCGIQTGAGVVLNVLTPAADDALAIFGGGGVGLAAVMAAAASAVATIVVVEPVARRREVALTVGATHVIDPAAVGSVPDAIRAVTGAGATHAFDTTAIAPVICGALEALAPRGTLALVGAGDPQVTIDVNTLIVGGKTIRGVVEGDSVPQDFLPRLLALHADGRLPLEQLVATYPFAEINTAVADSHSGATIKPVLVF